MGLSLSMDGRVLLVCAADSALFRQCGESPLEWKSDEASIAITGTAWQGWFIPSVHPNPEYAISITPSGWTGLGNGQKGEVKREQLREKENEREKEGGEQRERVCGGENRTREVKHLARLHAWRHGRQPAPEPVRRTCLGWGLLDGHSSFGTLIAEIWNWKE